MKNVQIDCNIMLGANVLVRASTDFMWVRRKTYGWICRWRESFSVKRKTISHRMNVWERGVEREKEEKSEEERAKRALIAATNAIL